MVERGGEMQVTEIGREEKKGYSEIGVPFSTRHWSAKIEVPGLGLEETTVWMRREIYISIILIVKRSMGHKLYYSLFQ